MRSDYMRHRRTLVQASLIASVLLIGSGCVSTDTHQKALDELEKSKKLSASQAAEMDEMRKNVGETWFAWSGPTEKGSAAYFRIQGLTVVIEYAPQRLGGDPTKHIHTIYRDPTNDYGVQWWKK